MISKTVLRMVAASALTILASCASSGIQPADDHVDLPPVPADLKVCFDRTVPAPADEAITKKQLFALIAKLKASGDDKAECGRRLTCWYEDIASGFAKSKEQMSPACRLRAAKAKA